VAKPHCLHRARLEIFRQHVRAKRQFANEGEPLRLAKFDGDPLLVAVGTEEIGVHATIERSPGATHLAVRQGFGLDNIGAEIGKDHGAEWPGQCTRQVDHTQTLKR
jgi:hypothetical protein